MPMNCAQLETTSHQNARLVPVEPHVKSSKTHELFNAGAGTPAQIAKSADPTCYNSPTVDLTGLFENTESNMSNAKNPRAEIWHTIEGKHFGQCVWQHRHPSGRALLEGLVHKATDTIMVVEKCYAAKLPPRDSGKPWPELESVNVYAPVDGASMTWDGLDAALAAFVPQKKAA